MNHNAINLWADSNGIYSCKIKVGMVPEHCVDSWISSTGGVICRKCSDTHVLSDNKTMCLLKQLTNCYPYRYYDYRNGSCVNCTPNCINCMWNSNLQYVQCLYCRSGYGLTTKNTCVNKNYQNISNCPIGTLELLVEPYQCIKCPDNCDICSRLPIAN